MEFSLFAIASRFGVLGGLYFHSYYNRRILERRKGMSYEAYVLRKSVGILSRQEYCAHRPISLKCASQQCTNLDF